MRALFALLAGLGLTLAAPAPADPPRQKVSPEASATQAKPVAQQIKDSKFWMEQKLTRTQNILAGLTRNDFEAVRENAVALNVLNHLEAYVRADVPEYKEQLQVFKFANSGLIRAAKAKNGDAATLAYTQLCVSCVNCHNVVRDTPTAAE